MPPGFDFSKLPTDLNDLSFDTAVSLLDNVDPNDLPILKEYDDYYEEDYYDNDQDVQQSFRQLRNIPFHPSADFYDQKQPEITSSNTNFIKFIKFSTTTPLPHFQVS